MNRLTTFREWCEKNGPIFDFFSKIIFALVTVSIAYFAVGIAKTQSEIQKAALEIQRIHAQAQLEVHLPKVQVRYSLRRSEDPRIDDLIVSNEGAELFSLEVEVYPFWHPRELELVTNGKKRNPNPQLKSALIPIQNYFSAVSFASSEPQGQLYLLRGRTHAHWNLAVREFEKTAKTEHRSITSETKLFSRIKYTDKFGQSHTRYFETQYWGMRPVPETEGKDIVNRYHQHLNSGNYINFETPTQKTLESNWKLLHSPKESDI